MSLVVGFDELQAHVRHSQFLSLSIYLPLFVDQDIF